MVLTLVGAGLTAGLVIAEGHAAELSPASWGAVIVGFAPLVGAQLTLGVPSAADKVRAWLETTRWPLLYTAGGFTVVWLVSQAPSGGFDPYATVIVAFGLVAAMGTLRQVRRGQRGLTWADVAVWMLLWIPFDLRWVYDLGGDYHWWAVALSVLGVVCWYGIRDLPGFGYRLVPRWRDIAVALAATSALMVILIPVGLAVDFLSWPPSQPPRLVPALFMFAGVFLTIAVPEELFFRGILQHGLDQTTSRRWLSLLAASFLFGLMHWNNAGDLTEKVTYVALATVAGMFYGLAYRRSGNSLLAPVLTHTLVDVIWATFFR
jgi:membrane protease YdiL (CAAX protease family)